MFGSKTGCCRFERRGAVALKRRERDAPQIDLAAMKVDECVRRGERGLPVRLRERDRPFGFEVPREKRIDRPVAIRGIGLGAVAARGQGLAGKGSRAWPPWRGRGFRIRRAPPGDVPGGLGVLALAKQRLAGQIRGDRQSGQLEHRRGEIDRGGARRGRDARVPEPSGAIADRGGEQDAVVAGGLAKPRESRLKDRTRSLKSFAACVGRLFAGCGSVA